MANYNSCSFIGHLGRDPEVRYTHNGKAVCNLNVAVSRTVGEKQITAWLKIVLWDKLAESIGKAAKKGDEITALNVEYCTDDYEKDGKKVASNHFTAHPGSRIHLNAYSGGHSQRADENAAGGLTAAGGTEGRTRPPEDAGWQARAAGGAAGGAREPDLPF